MSAHYPTDKGVAARVEELLREQLLELGEDPASLAPHLIMQNMQCEVYPDESMVYIWKDIPILRVAPERTDTGVMWRMFTRDEGEPAPVKRKGRNLLRPFLMPNGSLSLRKDSLSR